ncbi:MAG: hypothetical protein LPK07_12800 [Hymenobacteraceae bacterium]|nr:hypothetical protein [Hymenobacteraceae bacterium]
MKITLLDANSTAALTLLNEPKERGKYTLEVNLAALPNAAYCYKVEPAAGTKTKRILKR